MPQEYHHRSEQLLTQDPPPASTKPAPRDTIRLPQNILARVFIGSLLTIHFGILFLNNLAWSPAIASAWPYYAPYVDKLGLAQDWGMYQNPARFDQRIKAEGITPAGRQPIAAKILGWNSSRMLYLVEGLCIRNSTPEMSIYLSWIHDQIPKESRPEWGLTLQRDLKKIPGPNDPETRTAWRTTDTFFFWTEERQ
jgi:hypothetical protein